MPSFADLGLPARAVAALERARSRPLSYGVRAYLAPGERRRVLVVLGEAHLKLAEAAEIGREVVDAFGLRGVETFQVKKVLAGRFLGPLVMVPRRILRLVTLGAVKDSTIVDAKQLGHGFTVEVERGQRIPLGLHVGALYLTLFFASAWLHLLATAASIPAPFVWPLTLVVIGFELHCLALFPAILLRRKSWAWIVHPLVAIVAARDAIMARGTVEMLRDHPEADAAVVVMGRAHLPGFERELVDVHRFTLLTT